MGQRVLRVSRAYNLFGPKVIASRQGPGDAALSSRGFYIIARPSSRALAVLTAKALEGIERELQPKFLAFRLNKYPQLVQFDACLTLNSTLSARVEDMLRALALPIIGDLELERELLAVVAPHDKQARIEHHSEPEWAVVTALLGSTHVRGPGAPIFVTMKELAQSTEYVLSQTGESYQLTPRRVGEIVRTLGFQTQKLGSLGRGLRFSRELVVRVHKTAKLLGICVADLSLPDVVSGGFGGTCPDCEREGLMSDNQGNKLRYEEFTLGPTGLHDDSPFVARECYPSGEDCE